MILSDLKKQKARRPLFGGSLILYTYTLVRFDLEWLRPHTDIVTPTEQPNIAMVIRLDKRKTFTTSTTTPLSSAKRNLWRRCCYLLAVANLLVVTARRHVHATIILSVRLSVCLSVISLIVTFVQTAKRNITVFAARVLNIC